MSIAESPEARRDAIEVAHERSLFRRARFDVADSSASQAQDSRLSEQESGSKAACVPLAFERSFVRARCGNLQIKCVSRKKRRARRRTKHSIDS